MARPRKGHEKYATHRVSFRITEETRVGLDRLASRSGRPMAEEARVALETYVRQGGEVVAKKSVDHQPVSAGIFSGRRLIK